MSYFKFSKIFLLLRACSNSLTFKGKFYFSQAIFRRIFRLVKTEVLISDFDGKLQMYLRLSEHMQRRIFWMGYYSTDVIAILKKILKEEMVVIDVGANIGEITMVSAQLVGIKGTVISFEPIQAIASQLNRHVQINRLDQVLIRKEGLGQQKLQHVPIYSSCGQSGLDENHGLASLYGQSKNQKPIEYIDINTLDEVAASLSLSRIDLIKIDVEGGELACLLGARYVLEKYRPMLIVEIQEFSAHQAGWTKEDLFEYLENFGYEFFTIGKQGQLKILDKTKHISFQNVFCKVCES